MDVRLLGRFEVVHGGRALPLGGLRQRAVLALLLLRANEIVPVDRLVDEVWAGQPPAGVATTLRGYLFQLRKSLRGVPLTVETRKPGYLVVVDPWAIDVCRFEHLVDEGVGALAAGDPVGAHRHLRDGLALWTGPALADFAYEPFAEASITRLEELRLSAIEHRIEADLALAKGSELVGELEALVAAHPLREGYRAQLMRALSGAGRRADALRVYQEARRVFAEELGLEPSAELQRLERSILMDGATDAAAPAPVRPSGNLPASLTSFIGRHEEIEEVARLVASHRLVTLTGTGGSGKTRLALEVGAVLARTEQHAVWLVELAPITAADDVAATVAAALGVALAPERPVVDALVDALRPTSVVIVLDNCEHVRSGAAHVAFTLLQQCPRIRILATSRELLGVPGESAWRVPSLPVPERGETDAAAILRYDAVRLFTARAQTAVGRFDPTPDDARTIADICRRLDGIPLAIELAAARLATFTVSEVAARIEDRFRLLVIESDVVLPRHRTLRAVVDFSHDLLTEDERTLFARLSVFAGEFDLDLAERVCAGDGIGEDDVLDLLARLARRSLVARADHGGEVARFRLLETLRAYGAERLRERGEETDVRRRHAVAFLREARLAADGIFGRGAATWLEATEQRHDDHRGALQWAIDARDADHALALAAALAPFWSARHHIADGRRWVQDALAVPGGDARLRAEALAGLAELTLWDDDLVAADAACREGVELCDLVNDARLRSRLLHIRSQVARERDELDRAVGLARAAVQQACIEGDRVAEARAELSHAIAVGDGGDLDAAEDHAARCLTAAEAAGYVEGVAAALGTLGSIAITRGDLDAATERLERCLVHFRELGSEWSIARALSKLGGVALARGDARRAYELGRESYTTYETLASNEGMAEALVVMAEGAALSGDLEHAALLAESAVERSRQHQYAAIMVLALQSAAAVALRSGDLLKSRRALEDAVALHRGGQSRDAARTLRLLSIVAARQGDLRAVEYGRESLELATDVGDERGAARSLLALAEAELAVGDALAALRYLSAARSTGRLGEMRGTDHEGADYLELLRTVRARVPAEAFEQVWSHEPEGVDQVLDLRAAGDPEPAPAAAPQRPTVRGR